MDILVALRQEEAKWKKQANAARQQLDTVRAAIKLLILRPLANDISPEGVVRTSRPNRDTRLPCVTTLTRDDVWTLLIAVPCHLTYAQNSALSEAVC